MSNSPMMHEHAIAAAAGAWSIDDCAEIQRRRDALRSKLAVLEEARRRLEEIQIQHDAGGQHLVPGAAGDAADESTDDTAGEDDDDDFYPLDHDDEPEERPMQWQDQVCRHMVYSARHLQQLQQDDDLDLDDDDDDDDGDEISRDMVALGLHVPHIQTGTATPPLVVVVPGEDEAADRRGFGAVPASAAAIAGLKKHRYVVGSSGGDGMCVICMRSYKNGRRLSVMPCRYKHRFHGRCIREWLSRSNLCPLCRHALPTEDAERGGGDGGVHRRALVVRLNVNRY